MPLPAKLPLILATTSMVGIGTVYCVHKYSSGQEKELISFGDYREAFLDFREDTKLINVKLDALQRGSIVGSSKLLKQAKEKGDLNLLKKACEAFYEEDFVADSKGDFEDFKNYCSKSNKESFFNYWNDDFKDLEKVGKVIDKINARGSEKVISASLADIAIKHKENPKSNQAKEDLNKWCKEKGEVFFLGKDVLDFETGFTYCRDIQE